MSNSIKFYALKNTSTGKLMGFCVYHNDDEEFCNSVDFTLDDNTDRVWVTTDKNVADKVAVSDTPWYNSGFSSPCNNYIGQLEVVELIMVQNIEY